MLLVGYIISPLSLDKFWNCKALKFENLAIESTGSKMRIYIYKTLNSYGRKNESEKHYMSTKQMK